MSYFDSAVLLDEAAQADIVRTLTRGSTDVIHTQVAGASVSPTVVELSVATPGPC